MDFWLSIGSTYSYLTVMRLDDVERATGIAFRWRPFNVRALMVEMNNVPFRDKPVKAAYMWRDIERRAAGYGVPYAGPAPYPLADLPRANRVALLGMREGWGNAFVQAAYRQWFLQKDDVSRSDVLEAVLRGIGRDPGACLTAADAPAMHAALDAETQAARELGIFGVPTFAVGREIFWGDDRLDDAIAWQTREASAGRP
jgi:2-hydroxychromene-2-carboxylate isomerase